MIPYNARSNALPNWLVTVLGCALAVLLAQVVAAGGIPGVLLGLVLVVPALECLRRYPFWGLFIWLALSPFVVYTPTASGRMMYWVLHRALPPLAVGMVFLSQYATPATVRRLPRMRLPEFAMAGYILLSLVGIYWFSDEPLAVTYLFYDRVLVPMCLYLLIRLCPLTAQDLRRMMPFLVFLCLSQFVISTASFVAPDLLPSAWINENRLGERGVGTLRSPSAYTAALLLSGLLLLHAAMYRKQDRVRTLYLATFACSLVGVFLSFSRASWLSGTIIVACLIFIFPKVVSRVAVVGLVVCAVGSIFAAGVIRDQAEMVHERLYSEHAREAAMSRLPVAYASVQMFLHKPLFGWGYENHNRYDWEFQAEIAGYSPTSDHSSHNVFLTILAEQGLTGVVLFFTPCIYWGVASLRWLRQTSDMQSRHLMMMFWLVLLHNLIINSFSNMRIVYGLGLWWIALGLIAALTTAPREARA